MDSTTENLVEEREALMVFPCQQTHLLKPCFTPIDGSEAVLPRQNRSASSPPDLKASVSFHGWRFANTNFNAWARKMASLHERTWRKAGIFEAVMASTYRIYKNADLLLDIAEKWCPDTKTFVFSWGETTVTLEDVRALLGFSVLGLPLFATLDSSEEKKIQTNLEKEWVKIKNDNVSFVRQVPWVERFMDSGDELEHVAFLVLWLSYFVFPSRYYHISESILPIAVHLSSGSRIALAPAVLAHLYADLSLLKTHISAFTKSPAKIELGSMFKLVQVWTWERFKELQPEPNPLLKGEPRLARWCDLRQQKASNVRQILDSSEIDSFEWRPYTIAVRKWDFPKFYPEKPMWIPVGPNLDDEFISYARCINVSELVGIDCVEHYFPDRVASQFGMLQKVSCLVSSKNLSKEAAWSDYNKPIDDLLLYIPSRFAIPRSRSTSFVPSYSKINRRSKDGMKIAEDSTNKRRKYIKRGCVETESTIALCQKQVPSNNDGEDVSVTIAKMARLSKNKYSNVKKSGGDASEPLGKRSRVEADNNDSGHLQKFALVNNICNLSKQVRDKRRKYMKQTRESGGDASEQFGKTSRLEADNNDPSPLQKLLANGDQTVPPPDIEERNEEINETGNKTGENMFQSSDAPLGAVGVVDIVVSPPETRQTCNYEFDMINGGSTEPECVLHGDGAMAGEKVRLNEDLCIEAEEADDDDSLIQKNLAIEELASKACSSQKLASGGANGDETSMGLSLYDETNTSDPPVRFDGAADVVVSPPKTRETYNDELDVHGSNADMINDSSKEPVCSLQEDDKLCSEAEKENDVVAGYETVLGPEIEERNEETNETGSKTGGNMFQSSFDENNPSDAPVGANRGIVDIGVSPPETRQTCNDEFDIYGSNADMIDGDSTEPESLLQGYDGAIAGEEARSNEKLSIEAEKEDDDSLIQKKLAIEELALKTCSCEKLGTSDPPVRFDGATDVVEPETTEPCNDELDVHGSKEPKRLLQEDEKLCSEDEKEDDGSINDSSHMVQSLPDESNMDVNVGITVGDGNQKQDCLLHENGLESEGTPKSAVQLEDPGKSNDDVGTNSYGKRLHEVKVKLASIQEHINKAHMNLAWLTERRALKERNEMQLV